jgi:hypothetical protein
MNPPPGCRFNTRCVFATEICLREEPPLRELASGHRAACHNAEQLPPPTDTAEPANPASANTAKRMALYAERRGRIAATAG